MKRTKGYRRWNEAEMRRIIAGYESGTQSRAAYCAAHGVPVSTFDYYRRKVRPAEPTLVEIDLHGPAPAPGGTGVIGIVLRNGRRLEIDWAHLARVPDQSQALRGLLDWLEGA
jgi:hypothetical protein